ncbi:hypothetical protein TELCIR_19438, partial [Teladorsagia circumcincta]
LFGAAHHNSGRVFIACNQFVSPARLFHTTPTLIGVILVIQFVMSLYIQVNLVPPIDDPRYSMCNHSHPPVQGRTAAVNKMK